MNNTVVTLRSFVLLALALGSSIIAHAQTPVSHYAEPGLEIDGNYLDSPVDPDIDWFAGFPPFRDPIRQDDDTLCGTSPAPKNDLSNTFVANNFDYLYMGMERLSNHGNTSFFFTFDITGDGPSVGDFIFVFCFGSGQVVTDTYVLEYDAVRAEFVRDATPPTVSFAVNRTRIPAPFGALDRHGRLSTSVEPGQFGEARVTLADIEGFNVCAAADVTLEIQTKSSCSLRSECKDTSGPLHFSFTPLTADLELSQPAGCAPEITATAHATSPRPASAIHYRWFLNGDEITDQDPTWASSDSITIPLVDECGPTEVAVIVDDETCLVDDAASIDVNQPPVAGIGSATVGTCDGMLAFSGSGSSDCNGSALTYAWDFDGDGVVDSTDESGVHAYVGCGDRNVTLIVTDGECTSPPAATLVHVNAPPEAGLSIRASAASCLEIAFDVTSTDCDLSTASVLYTESLSSVTDFGDGTSTTTDLTGVHRYAGCGRYAVRTTTTDASGCASTVVKQVTVDVVATVD